MPRNYPLKFFIEKKKISQNIKRREKIRSERNFPRNTEKRTIRKIKEKLTIKKVSRAQGKEQKKIRWTGEGGDEEEREDENVSAYSIAINIDRIMPRLIGN